MQDRDALQKQLNDSRDANWVDARIKKLARWPGKKRQTLRTLIQSSRRRYDMEEFAARLDGAADYFAELSDDQRMTLWEGLFPKLAPHFERAWLDARHQPYQKGHARFPFRAPNRAEMIDLCRAHFFVLACEALQGLDPDAAWLAAWAPHLRTDWRHPRATGWLLSAVLRNGGVDAESVRNVLIDSINGEHEIGQMGWHVVVALLNSHDRDDWETIGKLLLAAQRQEGLRQAILEAVDESHPDAFRYMLGVIAEHNLGRFSATVRAFDVWLGMRWAGGSAKVVHDGVAQLIELFDDEQARARAIEAGEPEEAYLALWVTAYEDAETALAAAAPMLDDASPERRFVAMRLLEQLRLFPETLNLLGGRLLSGKEDDERLLMAIASFLAGVQFDWVSDRLFDATAQLFHRVPVRKKRLEPIVWPWAQYNQDRRIVARALSSMAQGAPDKLLPFVPALDSHHCAYLIHELAGTGRKWTERGWQPRKRRKLTPEARRLVIQLTCDTRQTVQAAAFQAIEPIPVEEDEVETLLNNLHRSAAAFRQGAIKRLSTLPDPQLFELIETLLADKHVKKRAAGLELATHLVDADRSADRARSLVAQHRDALDAPDLAESADRLLGDTHETISLDDCLGLVPAGSRCPTIEPRFVGVTLETDAARTCLVQIAELFLEHGEIEIELPAGELGQQGQTHALLASAGWGFPLPKRDADILAQSKARLPLADVWLRWLAERGPETRDPDGLELIRAWAWTERGRSYRTSLPDEFTKPRAWGLVNGYQRLIHWLAMLSRTSDAGSMLTQYVEDSLARACMSPEEKEELSASRGGGERGGIARRFGICRQLQQWLSEQFTEADKARLGVLALLALEQDRPGCEAGPSIENFLAAFDAGLANDRDLVWLLLYPRKEPARGAYLYGHSMRFGPIRELTGMHSRKLVGEREELIAAVDQIRDRLLEIELTRGEQLTPASIPAAQLCYAGGAAMFLRLAAALGRDQLVRQDQWGDPTRSYSFSRLISVTAPGEDDSPERFRQLFRESGLKPQRLLELAMFAPQWGSHAEHALEWDGLEEAIWWIHAHTKKSDYWRNRDFRQLWAAQINEQTALEADNLEEGAVDVAWFKRIIARVGPDGWRRLQKPAKYASNSGGHKRAQLFANAMLGEVSTSELIERIEQKRHQDSVRALGLVPLPANESKARTETLARYQRLQEFRRQSRKFGSQRQASEGRAVEIGMQNLARTAGYRDPRRLQWAMEAEAVADLAQGPVAVTSDETTVTLAIDDSGAPELSVIKRGKPLKNVPAKLRKHEPIAGLRSRVTELRRQRSRMRLSLEESMSRGDSFTSGELRDLVGHPMLRPMVERLVFIGDGDLIGYPAEDGRVLCQHDGRLEPIGKNDVLRVAHPVELLRRGDWHEWQRDCFAAERVQPFKQVFREIYPKTKAELDQCDMTRRYAGHQVNPRQALSLLKQRQWVHSPEEGVRRVHHDEDIIAELWFQQHFYTPAEVESLTLEGVAFTRRRDRRKRLLMEDVPDRIFSETMRDLDLVVSVAHAGGVDPEASASTVEMRATLLRETCQLLGLNNVRVETHHALIDGTFASYSVHLGSATTKVTPGRVMLIVAVHSQYRGRLFLPFADDDPKTAEVLAKSLMLARDDEIRDPSILEQIRS